MNCEKIQNELYEQFGIGELSTETLQHLESCAECREVWNELKAVSQIAPGDSAFYPDDELGSKILRQVESAIQPGRQLASSKILTIAASVVIVFGVSYLGLRDNGSIPNIPTGTDDTMRAQQMDPAESEAELDETSYELLFESVAQDPYRGSYDILIQELSDEDIDYLEKNLEAGELL